MSDNNLVVNSVDTVFMLVENAIAGEGHYVELIKQFNKEGEIKENFSRDRLDVGDWYRKDQIGIADTATAAGHQAVFDYTARVCLENQELWYTGITQSKVVELLHYNKVNLSKVAKPATFINIPSFVCDKNLDSSLSLTNFLT